MQDEGLAALGAVAQPVIDVQPRPTVQPFRLALRQAGAHGKIGLGQENGVAVVGGIAHRRESFGGEVRHTKSRRRGTPTPPGG